MTEHKVTCDCCGKNITATGYSSEWRVVLCDERMPHFGGSSLAMNVETGLDRKYEFCDMRCFDKWYMAKFHDA